MKINEYLDLLSKIRLNVTFRPDGNIKYKNNSKSVESLSHSIELLKSNVSPSLYGFHYGSGFSIIIKYFNDSKKVQATYQFEDDFSLIPQNLLDKEVKSFKEIEIEIMTNTTGTISYSSSIFEFTI